MSSSRVARNSSPPNGRPVCSWARSSFMSSCRITLARKARQLGANSRSGATRTSASSFPRTWAAALLQRYRLGVLIRPDRTGLSSTYRAADEVAQRLRCRRLSAGRHRAHLRREGRQSCRNMDRRGARGNRHELPGDQGRDEAGYP
jgi:hypothetical protein